MRFVDNMKEIAGISVAKIVGEAEDREIGGDSVGVPRQIV